MVKGYEIGNRIIDKSTKEIFLLKKFKASGKIIISKDIISDESDVEISELALKAKYNKIPFQKGDLIESVNLLAKFDKFSTYSVDIATCEWVFNKKLNQYFGNGLNEIYLSDFKFLKQGVGLEVNKSGELNRVEYDYINPNHYKSGSMETIDMMIRIWGAEKVISHCEITAFKYRMRAGKKPEQSIERDLEKARWYEEKAKELQNGLQSKEK